MIAALVTLALGIVGAQADEPAAPKEPSHAPDNQSATPSAPEEAPANETPPPPSPPQPPASESAPPASPPIPSNATVLDKNEIQGILGKKVLSPTGENMGQVANVIVDHGGQPRAVVIDFGGFLGVGSRKIAVDWNALHFAPEGKTDQVSLDLTRDELKSAPEYKEGSPVVVIGAAGNTQTVPAGDLP